MSTAAGGRQEPGAFENNRQQVAHGVAFLGARVGGDVHIHTGLAAAATSPPAVAEQPFGPCRGQEPLIPGLFGAMREWLGQFAVACRSATDALALIHRDRDRGAYPWD